MRIDVYYADEAPRVIETAGESLLSSQTMAGARPLAGEGRQVVAVMLRPRCDLMCRGSGLAVELSCWTAPGRRCATGEVADFGRTSSVQVLDYHVVWSWEVLPASDAARVIALDVDGRERVRRLGGGLCDLTAFSVLERRLLGDSVCRSRPLHARVGLVLAALRRAHPDMDDDALGDLYGLGGGLLEYARQMSGASPESDSRAGADDGLSGLVERVRAAASGEELVGVCADAILDAGADLRMLLRACSSRGVGTEGLAEAWDEAEASLAFSSF